MILVADNDAVLKLCAYGLWDEACAVLGVTEVRTLATARFVFRSYAGKADLTSRYTPAGLARALAVAERATPVAVPAETAERDALIQAARRLQSETVSMDAGEALLFASASQYLTGVFLTTGDKRALRALAVIPEGRGICERLSGRVLCVEQLVSRLVEHVGLPAVQQCVMGVPTCDGTLTNVFGRSRPASAGSVAEGLESYVGALRAETGSLLAP